MSFSSLGLSEQLVRATADQGYETPSPIQQQAIPAVLSGKDVMAAAQTGTGKTAGFTLPLLQRLAENPRTGKGPRALILTPTRELAAQVHDSVNLYSKYVPTKAAVVFGGVKINPQMMKLRKGLDVLVATPGRLMDLYQQNAVRFNEVEILVLDEADRMLDMGFIPDIEKICSKLPPRRQTLLFSATFPTDIQRLAKTFQRDPVKIEVARPTDAATTISQHVVHLPTDGAKAKRTALRRVIESRDVKNGIVFCNRKVEVDIVAASLTKHGHDAAPIHGDLPQSVRTETLQRFRDGDLKLLVASDVAARGLDIPDVGHVFNYGPPPKDEDYIHRVGRTGRAGRTGESFTLVSPVDEKSWGFVLKMLKQDVEEYMPDGLLEELENLPPEEKTGRGRRGSSRDSGRSRGGRSERSPRGARGRSRQEEPEAESETAVAKPPEDTAREDTPAKAEKPVKAEKPAKTEKAEKPEKPEKAEKSEKPEKPEKSEKPKRERAERKEKPTRDRKRKDDDLILDPAPEKVKGFGNDIPAFLKR